MQPGQEPPRPPSWVWIGPVAGVAILALAMLIFIQTREPVVIVFGFVGAVVLASILRPHRWYGWGYPAWGGGYGPAQSPQQIVKVKCASCGSLNDERARFCGNCGKPM